MADWGQQSCHSLPGMMQILEERDGDKGETWAAWAFFGVYFLLFPALSTWGFGLLLLVTVTCSPACLLPCPQCFLVIRVIKRHFSCRAKSAGCHLCQEQTAYFPY